jgi:general secretion pathway protein C
MRRLPLVASFVLFIALCASIAYWATQLFKPPVRPVAAPRVAKTAVKTDAAGALFGGRAGKAAVATNYQLRGVIFSGSPHDSVAIISADGKPAQAIRANTEVVPGVKINEVHRDYVLLSEGGVTKRVELPESAKDLVNLATAAPTPAQPVPRLSPPPAMPQPPEAPRVPKSSPQPPPSPAAAPPAVVVNPPNPPAPATTAPVLPANPAAGAGATATPPAQPAPTVPPTLAAPR